MRMRLKLDFIVEIPERESMPFIDDPTKVFAFGVKSLLTKAETAKIEPGGTLEKTLLGATGTKMWRPTKKKGKRK